MSEPQISVRIDAEETFDVVVVGGGIAAICAAIAAARNGCETALVEMDELLGGNGSPLLGVHVSGAHSFHPYASETGIVEELELEAARLAAKTRTWGSHYNISMTWDLVLQETLERAGVRVFRRHQGRRAFTEGRRVTGVLVEDIQHFRTKLFHVRHGIIDGSGDGTVAADAGASFHWGTDGKARYGERSAPEADSPLTMGTSLTALVRRSDHPVEFHMPPEFAARAAQDGPHQKMGGYPASWNPRHEFCFLWVTESGGERNTVLDDAEIRREILYQLYRCWDNVKNFSHVEEARNWELVWVSPKSGKRENRRFLGDVVLTQTDVEEARAFDDAIGYGGYGVDIHEVDGKRARVVFYSIPPLWSFPYRAAYSKDFDNLWLAGRLMSVSRLALGTVRLMRTLGCIGQGVGTAVALAKRHACTAREIYERHREDLQQTLLRQDATILTATNRDPDDLAHDAAVTATSEMRHGATRVTGYLPLDVPRGVQLWDWAPALEQVEVAVRNTTDREQRLRLHLSRFERTTPWKEERERVSFTHLKTHGLRMEWGSDNRVAAFEPVAEAAAVVPAGFEGWLTFGFAAGETAESVEPPKEIRGLIDKGKKKGSLAYDEISETLYRDENLDEGQIEDLLQALADEGIHIVDRIHGLPLISVDPTSDENRYNVLLDACPGIELGVDAHAYDFARRLWQPEEGDAYKVEGDCHAFRISPAPLYGEAANVVDGHNRRYSTNPVHAWLSDFDEPLPQSLTLTFPEPREVASVQLTFDTIERAYLDAPINCDERYARRCVTDYRVEVQGDAGWEEVACENGNIQRWRVHAFTPRVAQAIRLTVLGVRDPRYRARVYEVRAYGPA